MKAEDANFDKSKEQVKSDYINKKLQNICQNYSKAKGNKPSLRFIPFCTLILGGILCTLNKKI